MSDTVNVIDYLTRPERFRTQTRLAEAVGVTQSTIAGRRKSNSLSHDQMRRILTVAPDLGITITPDDFFPERED
jgi:transcriptional regulator with XRE-family HTH domain